MLKIVRAPESERVNLGITLNARPADAYRARVSKFPYNTPWPGRTPDRPDGGRLFREL